MVKIRLKRFGTTKRPYYRIVVMDSRAPREGKTLEEVGTYHPIEAKNQLTVNADRIKDWISKGARPTDTVRRLLNTQKIYIK